MKLLKNFGSWIWLAAISIFALIKIFYAKGDVRDFRKKLKDDVSLVNKKLKEVVTRKKKLLKGGKKDNIKKSLEELDKQIDELNRLKKDVVRKHTGVVDENSVNEVLKKLKNL